MLARLATLVSAGVVIGVPIPAASQQPGDAIPREVVAAVLRNLGGPGFADILVDGRLPDDLASHLALPPNGRVIAVLTPVMRGADMHIVGSAPGSADSLRAWFADEFERRGFVPVEYALSRRPFRPAERSPSNAGYCHAGRHYTVSAANRSPARVEFVIRVTSSAFCSNDSGLFRRPMSSPSAMTVISGDDAPELPLLYHPRTAEITARCDTDYRRTPSSQSTETAIATGIRPAALLAHYGAQLDSAGWTADTAYIGMTGSWTRPDSTGRLVRVIVTAETSSIVADCVALKMVTQEDRR